LPDGVVVLALDFEDDELLLPQAASVATQSSESGAASQLLLEISIRLLVVRITPG
jgi:hypothetical protein